MILISHKKLILQRQSSIYTKYKILLTHLLKKQTFKFFKKNLHNTLIIVYGKANKI